VRQEFDMSAPPSSVVLGSHEFQAAANLDDRQQLNQDIAQGSADAAGLRKPRHSGIRVHPSS